MFSEFVSADLQPNCACPDPFVEAIPTHSQNWRNVWNRKLVSWVELLGQKESARWEMCVRIHGSILWFCPIAPAKTRKGCGVDSGASVFQHQAPFAYSILSQFPRMSTLTY